MTRSEIIIAIARSMVAANQADWPKPAAEWTETDLFKDGFYADAEACYDAIDALGYVIQPKSPARQDSVDALANAIAAVFPGYRRISATQAATEIAEKLAETRHFIEHNFGSPKGA